MGDSLADKTKQAVDNIAGPGTSDKIQGASREAAGNVKQSVGEATGDEGLQAEGMGDKIVGKTQQVVGEVKQEASELAEKARRAIHEATK